VVSDAACVTAPIDEVEASTACEMEWPGFAACMAAVARFLRAKSIRTCDHDDLVQETALRLLAWARKGGQLREASGIAAARNVWLEALRAVRRLPRCASELDEGEHHVDETGDPASRTEVADFVTWLRSRLTTVGGDSHWQLVLAVLVHRRSLVAAAREIGLSRHEARRQLASSSRILATACNTDHY